VDRRSAFSCYRCRSAWCVRQLAWPRSGEGDRACSASPGSPQDPSLPSHGREHAPVPDSGSGEVEGVYEGAQPLADRFAIRRAASHGIEAAGILAFHASPVWILAALADLSGAGRFLIPRFRRRCVKKAASRGGPSLPKCRSVAEWIGEKCRTLGAGGEFATTEYWGNSGGMGEIT